MQIIKKVAGIVLLLTFITGCDTSNSVAPPAAHVKKQVMTQAKHRFPITVSAGRLQYTITDFRTDKSVGDAGLKDTAKGMYYIVYVTVKYMSNGFFDDSSTLVDEGLFKILYKGKLYEPDESATIALNLQDNTDFASDAQPIGGGYGDSPIHAEIVFDLPQNAKGLKFYTYATLSPSDSDWGKHAVVSLNSMNTPGKGSEHKQECVKSTHLTVSNAEVSRL
jgi:hypothetical protein